MGKILLGVLVLVGAGFLIFSSKGKENTTVNETQIKEDSLVEIEDKKIEEFKTEDFEEKTTLNKLMEKGGDYMCTFTHSTQVGESAGTVYISGKRIRGDFVSRVSVSGMADLGDIKIYMISDPESVYTWNSMSSEGMKVPASDRDNTNSSDVGVSVNQELDYKCSPWKVDASKFSLPTNITFKTFSEL